MNETRWLSWRLVLGLAVVCVLVATQQLAGCPDDKGSGIPDLREWQGEVQRGRIIPFSMRLGESPAEYYLVSTKTRSGGEWHETNVKYKVKKQPLTVPLDSRYDANRSISRLTLTLTASEALKEKINHIEILDLSLPASEPGDTVVLRGVTGGFADSTFPPFSLRRWEKRLSVGESFVLDSDRTGRSSNSHLPLLLYAEREGGVWLGPEWSGSWDIKAKRTAQGSRLLIGVPTFDFTMKAHEVIELPTAAFGVYSGTPDEGCNSVRRAILRHYLPAVSGKKPFPLVVFQGLGGLPNYYDETTMYREAERAAALGAEAFILDAQRYDTPKHRRWWDKIGHWIPSPERFPTGVTRFADFVHSKGMRFGLWLEPRMVESLDEYRQNKDLFLTADPKAADKTSLLNLGKEEAQNWSFAQIEHLAPLPKV